MKSYIQSLQLRDVVVVALARTAIGEFEGAFKNVPAVHLGGWVLDALVKRANILPADVGVVYGGMVVQGGTKQSPVKQAMKIAGFPWKIPAGLFNYVCGSSLYAIKHAVEQIQLGNQEIAIAFGMESPFMTPYYDFDRRGGARMQDGKIVDGMILDGLTDPYANGGKGAHMITCGDKCAVRNNITRVELDDYSRQSYELAIEANDRGDFANEIIPVELPSGKIISIDEELKHYATGGKFDPAKVGKGKGVFGGTTTAFNASKINQGAAGLVLMSAEEAERRGLTPIAKVHGFGEDYGLPEEFTDRPGPAIIKAIEKTRKADGKPLTLDDVRNYGIVEINEAFAVVAEYNRRLLEIDRSILNVNGGAVALGHPIGCSGARIVVTGLNALHSREEQWLAAGICLGGGGAIAGIFERWEE